MKKAVILAIALVAIIALVSLSFMLQRGEKELSPVEEFPQEEEGLPQEEEFQYTFTHDWLSKGNVWVFSQPPLDYLKEISATGTAFSVYYIGVNEYDRAYVEELHRNGFKVLSNFPTSQSDITDNGQLKEEAHGEDIYGNPIAPDYFGGQYWMCGNNPKWREFLTKRIEEHATEGSVDGILIDEIGASATCFCEFCMQAFNSYLEARYSPEDLSELFGINDLHSFDYGEYLLQHGARDAYGDPNPKLALEYFQATYETRVEFIKELVRHAKESSGWEIPVTGNTYGLMPDHQIYIPYLDFVVFETPITPELHDWIEYLRPLPGKLFTTYLLAEALDPNKPFTAFPDVFDLANLSEEEWWLWRHWLAEARSCGASFMIPWRAYTFGEGGAGAYTIDAEKISPYTVFFAAHPQYYENLERIASVAVLHDLHSTLTNQFTWLAHLSWRSFENVGVLLQEAHIPFEVIYRGDGKFVQKPLTLEGLSKYKVVVVPRNYDLDGEAQDLLSQYSALGGRIVRCDELPDDSALVSTLKDLVDPGLETNASEDLGMMVYRRGDSLLIHMINYSYDRGARDFSDQRNVEVTLMIPEGVSLDGKALKLVSPDTGEATLEFRVHGERVTFTVPSIHCYSIVSFE
ncbi:MAG: beta-galactosidase [Candidatus Hadarchaeaceae archaeon]